MTRSAKELPKPPTPPPVRLVKDDGTPVLMLVTGILFVVVVLIF